VGGLKAGGLVVSKTSGSAGGFKNSNGVAGSYEANICYDIITYWMIYETKELYPLLASPKGELLCYDTKECSRVGEGEATAIAVKPKPARLIYLRFQGYGYYEKWLRILASKSRELRLKVENTLRAVEREGDKARILAYFIVRGGEWEAIPKPEDYNESIAYLPPSCLDNVTYTFLDPSNPDPTIITITVEEWSRVLEAYKEALATKLEEAQEPSPQLAIQPLQFIVKKPTEREMLAENIAEELARRFKIKTFMIESTTKETILGIYCFDGIVWRPCEERLKATIEDMVAHSFELKAKTTRWVVNEAMRKITDRYKVILRYDNLKIAFRNKVYLDWERFLEGASLRESIEPANPDSHVFHLIPHNLAVERLEGLEGLARYNESLEGLEELAKRLCPKTLETFKQWVGGKWIVLFEIIGYTLYPKYDLHKAIMLVGEGSNGKSTYLRLLRDILGAENYASIPLQELADPSNRFAGSELYHKLANIVSDLPKRALQDTGRFKMLTGEDYLCIDRKFRDRVCFVNYAKLIFSANELPQVYDMTEAFWRRWVVIEFPNKFPRDPTFYERTFTEEEKEGAIIVGLIAFREVWRRRRFSFEETEEDYKEVWLRSANPVYECIMALVKGEAKDETGYTARLDPNAREEADKLYSVCLDYLREIGRELPDKATFTKELEKLFNIKKKKIGRNRHYYYGIILEEVKETGEGLEAYST